MRKHLYEHREKTSVFLSILVMCLLSINFLKSHQLSGPFEKRFIVSGIILLLICLFFRFCLPVITPMNRSLYRISLIMAFWSLCFFFLPFPDMVLYLIPAPGFYFLFRIETKKEKILEDILGAGILMAVGTFLYIQQRPLQAILFPGHPFDWTGYYLHAPVIILMGAGFLRLNKYSEWKELCLLGTLLFSAGVILFSGFLLQPFWSYFPVIICTIVWLHMVQAYFGSKYDSSHTFIKLTGISETEYEKLGIFIYFICAFTAQACIARIIFGHGSNLFIIPTVILALMVLFYKYRETTLSIILIEMAGLFFISGTFFFKSIGLFWCIPTGIIILFCVISRMKKGFPYPVHNRVITILIFLYYLFVFQFNLLNPAGITYILFPFICWGILSDRPFSVSRTNHFSFWPVISFIIVICLFRGIQQEFFITWALLNLAIPLIVHLIIRTEQVKTYAIRMKLNFINDWEENSRQALSILAYISAAICIISLATNFQWYIESWVPISLTILLLITTACIFLAYALTDKTLGYVIRTEIFFWLILAIIRWKLDTQEILNFGSPLDGYFFITIAVLIAGVRDIFKKKVPEFSGYFKKTILVYGLIGWLYLQVFQFLLASHLTGSFHHAELSSVLMAAFNVWLSKARKSSHTVYTFVFMNAAVLLYFFNLGYENLMFYIFPAMSSALILIELFKDKLGKRNARDFRLIISLILCGTASFYNIIDFDSSIWFPVIATLMSICLAIAGISLRIRIFLSLGATFFVVNAVGVIAHIIINQPPENITLSIGVLFLVAGIFFTVCFLFFQMKRKQIIDHYYQITNQLKAWE